MAVGTEVRRQMVPCLEMHIASNFVGTHGIQGRPNTRENVKENKTEIISEKSIITSHLSCLHLSYLGKFSIDFSTFTYKTKLVVAFLP